MTVPNAWHRALAASVPVEVRSTPPAIATAEDTPIPAAAICMTVLAPLATYLAWKGGHLTPAANLAHGSWWGTALAALLLCSVLYLVGAVLVFLLFSSTLMMVIRSRGMARLDSLVLLWALAYAGPNFRHGTAHHRAKMILVFCRVWLWRLDERQLRNFFALAPETRCSLGELKALAVLL